MNAPAEQAWPPESPNEVIGIEDKGFCLATYRPSWLKDSVVKALDVFMLAHATADEELAFLRSCLSMLAVLCNALVCPAVWLTYSARTTTDRVLAVVFPISAFVAAGFEHSIANMYCPQTPRSRRL